MTTSDTTDCGCCAGTEVDTPAAKSNRPGLPAIAYRIGRHPDFKGTLLARLSGADFPALAALTSRSDDDYTVALCDAFATMADVLTFYPERIANESYLRTATERRSVLELARLIGYQLAPGVAAGTAFAFTLEDAPGAPALAAQPVTIPTGTRVLSSPDPGQDAQSFETSTDIIARVEWNAIPAQQSEPQIVLSGLSGLDIAGTATQIQPGDAIVIIAGNVSKVLWIDTVEIDASRNLTHVTWPFPLDNSWPSDPASAPAARVYAFRQRASLFGNGAPDANLLRTSTNSHLFESGGPPYQW
jgi:hypothetical protein